MMALLHLPLDKLYEISEYLSQHDLSCLLQTCKALNNVLRDEIFIREVKYHSSEVVRWACFKGNIRTIQRVLEANVSYSAHGSIVNHHFLECRCRWSADADGYWPANTLFDPLSIAVSTGRLRTIQFLLDHGAEAHRQDKRHDRYQPINWAAELPPSQNRIRIVDLLVAHGADINGRLNPSQPGETIPIFAALTIPFVSRNEPAKSAQMYNEALSSRLHLQTKFLQRVLEHGADSNAICSEDSFVKNPLTEICSQLDCYTPMFDFDVKYATQEEKIAQYELIQKHFTKCIKMLIKAGANIDGSDTPSLHEPPLVAATRLHETFPQIIRLLIKLGANVNLTDRRQTSAIERLLEFGTGKPEVVEYIIGKGAELHRPSPGGTLLHVVVGTQFNCANEQQRIRLAKLLVKKGCRADVRNSSDMLPEDWAHEHELFDLSKYLSQQRKRLEQQKSTIQDGPSQISANPSQTLTEKTSLACDGLNEWRKVGHTDQQEETPTGHTDDDAKSNEKAPGKKEDDTVHEAGVLANTRNGLPRERWIARWS